ncbi:unnamed protein product [Linum trigynum]|uniref:Uncharacterized protein n=1 Tax=Linum trigynum TaxID=586398 RepID=A0AAV2DPS1_9ROSI
MSTSEVSLRLENRHRRQQLSKRRRRFNHKSRIANPRASNGVMERNQKETCYEIIGWPDGRRGWNYKATGSRETEAANFFPERRGEEGTGGFVGGRRNPRAAQALAEMNLG